MTDATIDARPDAPALLEEQRGRARWLTLNREARGNSISPLLLVELRDALARAELDEQVSVVCLTGAGERAFCSGADLGGGPELFEAGALAVHEGRRAYAGLLLDLAKLGKPVVACVNGAALAGGLGILCACDLAVSVDDARFGTPEIDRGLFPYMAIAVIERCIGRRHALDLALTGRKVDAAEALRMGLVNRVVPRAQLTQETTALVEVLCQKSPAVLRLGRRAFYAAQDLPFEAQLELLAGQLSLNALADDAAEGMRAFLEKRAPSWKGR